MIIVSALLERGDLFKMSGNGSVTYRVKSIGGRYVSFVAISGSQDAIHKIGVKSKQKLILLKDGDFRCPPEKLKHHMSILVREKSKYTILAD